VAAVACSSGAWAWQRGEMGRARSGPGLGRRRGLGRSDNMDWDGRVGGMPRRGRARDHGVRWHGRFLFVSKFAEEIAGEIVAWVSAVTRGARITWGRTTTPAECRTKFLSTLRSF
jgi:hypothetical protein